MSSGCRIIQERFACPSHQASSHRRGRDSPPRDCPRLEPEPTISGRALQKVDRSSFLVFAAVQSSHLTEPVRSS